MVVSNSRAILKASRMDGLYRPFSREPTVCRDTSSASASSYWVIPLAFRSSYSRFFTPSPPLKWKARFPSCGLSIVPPPHFVKLTFH